MQGARGTGAVPHACARHAGGVCACGDAMGLMSDGLRRCGMATGARLTLTLCEVTSYDEVAALC